MKVVFAGYRSWAKEVINAVAKNENIAVDKTIYDKETYDLYINEILQSDVDVIVFLGWSWIIADEVLDKKLCIGIHPSDLPQYRGGSPIQNQIINGVDRTNISLMTLSKQLDAGEIWGKEPVSLDGDCIDEIFIHIADSAIQLLNNFFISYPNIVPIKQNIDEGSYYKRRKPEESKLTLDEMKNMTLNEIYDFIRCLTDPYPNAYLEDDAGNRLYFCKVKYEKR